MGEITDIDLFVHPLFSCSKKPWKSGTYSKDDVKKRMVQLNARIVTLRWDKKHILIYLSNTLKKKDFSLITNSDLNRIPAYLSDERQIAEATLIRYVEHQLINWYFDRAFFFEDNPNFFFKGDEVDDDLKKIGERIAPKHATVWVHGEQEGDCVSKACNALSESLGIPRKNFKFSQTLSGNKRIKEAVENTEKITKIDLLVQPFFSYPEKSWLLGKYSGKGVETRMKRWMLCVDEIKKDRGHVLVYLSNSLYEEEFLAIKRIRVEQIPMYFLAHATRKTDPKERGTIGIKSMEAHLVKYASENLGDRLFFFEDNPVFFFRGKKEGEGLENIRKLIDPKKTGVRVYGGWISDCCVDAAATFSNRLGIPRANFKFLPKLSDDSPKRYLSIEEIEWIKKLPKKDRHYIIEFIHTRMREYNRRVENFKENLILPGNIQV